MNNKITVHAKTPYYSPPMRLAIYRRLLSALEVNVRCGYMEDGFCGTLDNIDKLCRMSDLPELMKHRPPNPGLFWWPRTPEGLRHRISVLRTVIEEVEKLVPCEAEATLELER